MHSIRSIRLRVRFDRFSILTTSWTALASSAPLNSPTSAVAVEQYRGVQSEIGEHAMTQVSYVGSSLVQGPRAIAHASSQVLGSSKLISNHYADYGL